MPPAGDDHGFVGSEASWRMSSFIHYHGLGRGRMAETGFWIEVAPDTVLAPDYAFISYERMSSRLRPEAMHKSFPTW